MLQSSSSEKKLVKPLKNCFLDPSCTETGSLWATPTMEKDFLAEITKADHLLPESFYFIKISYVLTEFWICSILNDVFYQVWLDLTLINQSIKTNIFHCLIIKIHQLLLQCFNESPFTQLQKLSHKSKELLRTPVQLYHLVS